LYYNKRLKDFTRFKATEATLMNTTMRQSFILEQKHLKVILFLTAGSIRLASARCVKLKSTNFRRIEDPPSIGDMKRQRYSE